MFSEYPGYVAQLSVDKFDIKINKISPKKAIISAFFGVIIGAVNGIFGSGGGMLAVPALTMLGFRQKNAHATAIALILPLCAIAVAIYSAHASFDMTIVLPTVAGVVAGACIGAAMMKKMASEALSFLFYSLMLFAGLKMIF